MSNLSTYTAEGLLNWLKGSAMPTAPTAVYIGLFSSDPTDANTGGTEVTTTIRVAGRLACTFGAIASKAMSNSAAIDFGNAAGGATVTHFAAFDAATVGNKLFSGALVTPRTVTTGDPVKFIIGDLDVSAAT